MESAEEQLAKYAKDRYESARSTLSEFRKWSRELAVKIAATIGLFVTLTAVVLSFVARGSSVGLLTLGLLLAFGGVVLVVLGRLLWLYGMAVKVGYEIIPFTAPHSVSDVLRQAASVSPANTLLVVTHEYMVAQRQRQRECGRVGQALMVVRSRFLSAVWKGLCWTIALALLVACSTAWDGRSPSGGGPVTAAPPSRAVP